MRKLCGGLLILAAALEVPQAIRAQSLADVARAEEARRKTVRAPAKVYTNDDLKRGGNTSEPTPAVTAPATATPASSAKVIDAGKPEAPKPDAAQDEPKKDEKFWRDRITAAQDALRHDKVLADALQSRINALTNDFASTDDPAQRAVVEDNRKTAIAETDRINKDIEKQTKAIADIQEEARKANVPPGWLR